MKKILFGWFVFVCVLFFAQSAFACSCAGPPLGTSLEKRILDEYTGTFAVFVGEVKEAKHDTGQGTIDVTFKVTRVLKGGMKVNDFVTVRTTDYGPACGIEEWQTTKVGVSWVIYARQSKGPRPKGNVFLGELIPLGAETILVTTHCSRTKPAASAADDLKYFDSLKK